MWVFIPAAKTGLDAAFVKLLRPFVYCGTAYIRKKATMWPYRRFGVSVSFAALESDVEYAVCYSLTEKFIHFLQLSVEHLLFALDGVVWDCEILEKRRHKVD